MRNADLGNDINPYRI